MNPTQLLYGYSSVAIAITLFITILIFNELGFRTGRYVQLRTDNEIKTLTGSIQASILGLLALLLGFTFSMSMQRFDSRSMALISEVRSIGNAQLRVKLLPEQQREAAMSMLRDYVDLRIAIGQLDLTRSQQRREYHTEIARLQNDLWDLAVTATDEDPRAITTGAFSKALTDLIDAEVTRTALLQMHVPEVVLLLLFLVFVSSGGILGYSSGLTGNRVTAPVVLVSLLITLIVFIIIDLDRPRRGMIQVDRHSLVELRESFATESHPAN